MNRSFDYFITWGNSANFSKFKFKNCRLETKFAKLGNITLSLSDPNYKEKKETESQIQEENIKDRKISKYKVNQKIVAKLTYNKKNGKLFDTKVEYI